MNPILYNADGSKSSAKPLMNMLNQKTKIREDMTGTCSSLQLNGAINATDFNMVNENGEIIMSFSTLMNQYNSGSGPISGGSGASGPGTPAATPAVTSAASSLLAEGEPCTDDNKCSSLKCSRTDHGDNLKCCKYNDTNTFAGYQYCTHIDNGESCIRNTSCASGNCKDKKCSITDGSGDLYNVMNLFYVFTGWDGTSPGKLPPDTMTNIKNKAPGAKMLVDSIKNNLVTGYKLEGLDITYMTDLIAKYYNMIK
jgi:hypothetical protein